MRRIPKFEHGVRYKTEGSVHTFHAVGGHLYVYVGSLASLTSSWRLAQFLGWHVVISYLWFAAVVCLAQFAFGVC